MKGPPITVSCHCGNAKHVPYGETWTCETCARIWNTAQIPPEQYHGIMREMRNFRLVVIGVALGVTLTFAVLAYFVATSLVLLLPLMLMLWFIWFMPWWRRRIRLKARALPTWQLTPE